MGEFRFEKLGFEEIHEPRMLEASRDFLHRMRRRRTVRDFSSRSVPMEIIENALAAAGTAPSGANMQPWHFVVVSDPAIKTEIRRAAEIEEKEFYEHRASAEWLAALAPLGTDENKPFLEEAPFLIAVFLRKFSFDAQGRRFKNYYTPESVGIATGILITALHLSGLATLTHTPSPMKFLNEILKRPAYERPFLIVVAGYPAKDARVPVIGKQPLGELADFV